MVESSDKSAQSARIVATQKTKNSEILEESKAVPRYIVERA